MTTDRVPASLVASDEGTAAAWATTRLRPWPTPDNHVEVGSLVPDGFRAYVAIRHASGLEDDLSDQEARWLAGVLADFTETPGDCWFCIWDCYGDIEPSGPGHAVVHKPGRGYLLFQGPLAAVSDFPWEYPQLWWPEDRAWCVGSDMDLARTFVGGSAECIAAIAGTELDTEIITADVTVDETNHLRRLSQAR